MYEITVEISFSASHRVSMAGEIEPLHEHNWTVRACFQGWELDSDGLLVDFVKVKKVLTEIADKLQGRDLSVLAELVGKNPSAENVARYFYEQLATKMDRWVGLAAVSVQEAPGCWASYRP